MLMAAKVPSCAALALDAVYQQGMCVVIGLQSTGEANTTAVSAPFQSVCEFGDTVDIHQNASD
jgi:hypothetical protein